MIVRETYGIRNVCRDCGAGRSQDCTEGCADDRRPADVIRPPGTVWQQNADMAATRDREQQASVVLDVAVKCAIQSLRGGRPGYALFQLEKAAMRAERILGPTDWTTRAAGAR